MIEKEIKTITEDGIEYEVKTIYEILESGEKKIRGVVKSPKISEDVEPDPTEQELINAEILLNQAEILNNQNATDEVLAEILLNQIGG